MTNNIPSGIPVPQHILMFLVLALGLRLIFFIMVAPWKPENAHVRLYSNDTKEYEDMAQRILSGEEFSVGSPYTTDIRRTPSYPLLLAAVYGIFAKKRFLVLLIQIVLGAASTYLAYRIGSRILDERAGILTGYLLAVDYLSVIYCMTILTETLFVFLLLAGVFFWLRFIDSGLNRDLAFMGLIMGVGALCKPMMLYFPALLFIMHLFNGFRRQAVFKRRLREAAVGILFFFLPLTPWLARNTAIFGTPIFTSIKGYNLLFYNAAYLEQYLGEDVYRIRGELEKEVDARIGNRKVTISRRAEIMQRVALEKITAHPLSYIKVHLVGILPILLAHGKSTIFQLLGREGGWIGERHHLGGLKSFWYQEVLPSLTKITAITSLWIKMFSLAVVAILLVFLLGIAYGIILLWPKRTESGVRLLVTVIGYFLIIGSPVGSVRFKLILMPFFIMLFAVAARKLFPGQSAAGSGQAEGN